MSGRKLFSVIIDTYFRPRLLKVAVEAVLTQTYTNVELILIDNGATLETREYLDRIAAADPRVRLIHFTENQFRPDDPCLMIETCYNAGLRAATGDYVFHQADDDVMALDYVEKMVALFEGNPECTSAAGLPLSIDADGRLMTQPRTANFRPRYTDGNVVALDHMRGGKMFAAAGGIFAFKRDVLIQAGGYHRAMEISHLYGIVPFGITGFDETAAFYWRRHAGQLSKQLEVEGYAGLDDVAALIRDWRLEERWRVFGPDVAREVVRGAQSEAEASAAGWCAYHVRQLNPVAAFRVGAMCYRHAGFWRRLPLAIWHPFKDPLLPFRLLTKASLRGLFLLVPRGVALPPRIQALRARVVR